MILIPNPILYVEALFLYLCYFFSNKLPVRNSQQYGNLSAVIALQKGGPGTRNVRGNHYLVY